MLFCQLGRVENHRGRKGGRGCGLRCVRLCTSTSPSALCPQPSALYFLPSVLCAPPPSSITVHRSSALHPLPSFRSFSPPTHPQASRPITTSNLLHHINFDFIKKNGHPSTEQPPPENLHRQAAPPLSTAHQLHHIPAKVLLDVVAVDIDVLGGRRC